MTDGTSRTPTPVPRQPAAETTRFGVWALAIFLGLWLVFQIVVPLRHLLYPGSPSWNEEGHRFSWRMKLRDKKAEAVFIVRDPATGEIWEVRPDDFLMPHQARKVGKRPDMILQFAHYLAKVWAREEKVEPVEVRARICVSLNGRKAALLIDPERDLTRVERSLRHADWVLPLEQPFERPPKRMGRRDLNC